MSEHTLDPSIFGEMRDLMDDALEEFINTYLENSPLLINKMQEGLDNQNTQDVFHTAHQLKGGSGSIGATKLANIAKDIEQIAKGGSTAGIETLLSQLKQEFELVEKALKAEL
jgi:histidine phosphotransfer protein HptB